MEPSAVKLPVLFAEDDTNDAYLFCRAFEEAGVPNPLQVVHDGAEAIEYLTGQGRYAARADYPLPGLLLTDLKMPRVNGFELLEWLRRQARFQDLPVIAVSSSSFESDLEKALALGAREYKVKPSDFRGLVALAREIKEKWLQPPGSA